MELISAVFLAGKEHIRNRNPDSVCPALRNAAPAHLLSYVPVATKAFFFSMIANVAPAVARECSQI